MIIITNVLFDGLRQHVNNLNYNICYFKLLIKTTLKFKLEIKKENIIS